MNIFDCCYSSSDKINQSESMVGLSYTKACLSQNYKNMKTKIRNEKNTQQIRLSKVNEKNKSKNSSKGIINTQNSHNFATSAKNIKSQVIKMPYKNVSSLPENNNLNAGIIPNRFRTTHLISCLPVQPLQNINPINKTIKVELNKQFLEIPKPQNQIFRSDKQISNIPIEPINSLKVVEQLELPLTPQPSSHSIIISSKRLDEIQAKNTESICDSQIFEEDEFSQVIQSEGKLFLSHLVSTDQKFIQQNRLDAVNKRKTFDGEYIESQSNRLKLN